MIRYRATTLFALALLLAGCQNFSAIAPGTPSQEVQAHFGTPNSVWKSADGSEVWEYPRGRTGVQKCMIAIDPDRTVRSVNQVLTETYFSKVQLGMSRNDVSRLLGTPREIVTFERRNEEVWTWPYLQFSGYMLFHVHFDRSSGTVELILRLEDLDYLVGD
jgi:CAP-associated N-terminal